MRDYFMLFLWLLQGIYVVCGLFQWFNDHFDRATFYFVMAIWLRVCMLS